MNEIKFSKEYAKLWGQSTAKLIRVENILMEGMHPDLIEYDTKALDGSYYRLPSGWLLQLTFLGDKGIPFCTLRSFSQEKDDYYGSLVGQTFRIVRTWEGAK